MQNLDFARAETALLKKDLTSNATRVNWLYRAIRTNDKTSDAVVAWEREIVLLCAVAEAALGAVFLQAKLVKKCLATDEDVRSKLHIVRQTGLLTQACQQALKEAAGSSAGPDWTCGDALGGWVERALKVAYSPSAGIPRLLLGGWVKRAVKVAYSPSTGFPALLAACKLQAEAAHFPALCVPLVQPVTRGSFSMFCPM
jgi:hypothetical protein